MLTLLGRVRNAVVTAVSGTPISPKKEEPASCGEHACKEASPRPVGCREKPGAKTEDVRWHNGEMDSVAEDDKFAQALLIFEESRT